MSSWRELFREGILTNNPVYRQVLGICSTLAVTNLVSNTLVMGAGLTLVTAASSLTISALRKATPSRIRMIVQVAVIATYVLLIDLFLQAFAPEISARLGPYVGLIITNCIIMGRAEAFAAKNPPGPAFLDGLAMGMGYWAVLMAIAVAREVLGFGTLMGVAVLPPQMPRVTVMAMAPGAFFMLAVVIWVMNRVQAQGKGR